MAIIISENGRDAKRLSEANFPYENDLQAHLANNPDIVPLYEIKEDIQLLVLARELDTNSGPIDAFGVDQEGNIYLIETKLYKNEDKRRVVAQVLDYGAALWKSSIDFGEFMNTLDAKSLELFKATASEKMKQTFGVEDSELNLIVDNMQANLNSGNFKFVVLMDRLEQRLKDLILFLNQNSQFSVYAVEFEYYQHDKFEIVIPKIHGTEVKKEVVNQTQRKNSHKKWDEPAFLLDVNTKLGDSTSFLDLYNFSKEKADEIRWGRGASVGSANFVFRHVNPRSVYSLKTNGELGFNFGWLNDEQGGSSESVKYRDELYEALVASGLVMTTGDKNFWATVKYQDWKGRVREVKEILVSVLVEKIS